MELLNKWKKGIERGRRECGLGVRRVSPGVVKINAGHLRDVKRERRAAKSSEIREDSGKRVKRVRGGVKRTGVRIRARVS